MKEKILHLLRCPECKAAVELTEKAQKNGEITAGNFTCTHCAAQFEINNGVPVFLPLHLSREVDQVKTSYSAKWNRVPDIYDEDSFSTRHQHEWYLTRYHWQTEERLHEFLSEKSLILDAGCGLGRDIRWYAALSPNAEIVGADLSEGAYHAYEKSQSYPNLSVIRADLNKLPFAPGSFDFVVCEQVLPVVEDPFKSIEYLWSLVKPGGHFAFYVYKKKSPIREFTDDFLREKVKQMSPEDGWKASENITRLGKALSDLNVEFELPNDIPELEIKAGRYNVQRFFYYHVLKCFWNENMTFDENVLVNFDWFHPAYTFRHTAEEVERWCRELGMKILTLDREDLSGISVLVEK
jgi:SAM-dependent methyltransferase/uncharacterized protein YbaR (Trm112 family)